MKYELHHLETLVRILLKNEEEEFDLQNVTEESARICAVFAEKLPETETKSRYDCIRIYQQKLVELADEIYFVLKEKKREHFILPNITTRRILELEDVYKLLEHILYSILSFLPDQFANVGKVPDFLIIRYKQVQEKNHLFMEKCLSERGINITLSDHLIASLKFEDGNPADEITFDHYFYIIKMQNQVLSHLMNTSKDNDNYKIFKIAVALNFKQNII